MMQEQETTIMEVRTRRAKRLPGVRFRFVRGVAAAFVSVGVLSFSVPAMGQRADVAYSRHALDVSTGVHDGAARGRIAASEVVAVDDATCLRLHIGDYNLGERSFIILRSQLDGDEQRLDAKSLPIWQNGTAIFNGGAVEIELHVAPGDEGVFVSFDEAVACDPVGGGGVESICGSADNRAATSDNRTGRLYFGGCTAWFITNGAYLTAGHCVDTNRDGSGNPAPDGVLDLSGVVEFNIPASTSNGVTNAAGVNDQYPILTSTVVWNYDGVNTIGEDWAVFEVGPNSNHGQMPWKRYNVIGYRPSRENPAVNDIIRITGCGLDNLPSGTGGAGAPCCTRDSSGSCNFDCNSSNFTLQTHSGGYVGQTFDNSNDISLNYKVDTTGGNSGSPIIWLTPSPDVAIGIHTNAGCTSSGGSNQGTAFEVNALEIAIRNVTGSNSKFVDDGHPLPGGAAADGTILRPFATLPDAVTAASSGAIISLVKGSYTKLEGNTLTMGADGKTLFLEAPVGSVTIGN